MSRDPNDVKRTSAEKRLARANRRELHTFHDRGEREVSEMLKVIETELNRHDFAGERGPVSQTGCKDDNWRGVGLKTPDFNHHVAECIVRRIAAFVVLPDEAPS